MKQSMLTTVSGYLFVALAGSLLSNSVSANAAGDCRQEAMDYEVAAEQLDDYISGCLASRGEYIDEDATEVEFVPPEESLDQEEVLQESVTDEGEVTY